MNSKLDQQMDPVVIQTTMQAMVTHSFFADHLNKKDGHDRGRRNKSFIPWLVNRTGGNWNDPHLVVNFNKIHISTEILDVWKAEAQKDPSLPNLDEVPGIKAMKKDMTGFQIQVDPDAWKTVHNITRYYH